MGEEKFVSDSERIASLRRQFKLRRKALDSGNVPFGPTTGLSSLDSEGLTAAGKLDPLRANARPVGPGESPPNPWSDTQWSDTSSDSGTLDTR